jgi:hypothetical protein
MIRYCTYCGIQIANSQRLRRASPYCSDEHRRLARGERRNEIASGRCRLCGLTQKPKKAAVIESSGCAPGAQGVPQTCSDGLGRRP